ncbi:UDP-galactopyranose mutase [Roseovarius atlanticus]|uniref:UDP-galactopyranose mutase n=1 Tax=Roseovarius atlanticus TaxID=1641875 RepID=UPI001C9738B8|nr:UDP-galactopyranose mutase [Roseovarius atlanticus]MBY5989894.1 UDP-galactopyranose mutase [Roseovarius atlanticus]MBY6126439.1 UDP-galactopyranose mutase [Roseovarius atlanticus]MBY6150933.1 UDP-galactopyranose mutase [Roseovarius atlanticus]
MQKKTGGEGNRNDVWIAGAGLSAAVVARELAEAGHHVQVFEARDHIAGNCYTERDPETGIILHRYGPHIFHTGDDEVWDYVNRFTTFVPYDHKVWTTVGGRVFPLPISLATINQFYGRAMGPAEARDFLADIAEDIPHPRNFEEQALSMIGRDLYEAFFKGYTEKQWGRSPTELPASILKRLPVRFSYEGSYFAHAHQALPRDGYTPMVEAMLDHPSITVHISTPLDPAEVPDGVHLFWSGPLDAYFDHVHGHLGYRTLDFRHERTSGDFQGCPVMNYGEPDVPYTRITEHKHFAPWESHDSTIITREYSREAGPDDIPYYPIRLTNEKEQLALYVKAAKETQGVTFLGRLATYRYLDMDVCIREALDASRAFLAAEAKGERLPALLVSP